MKRRVVTKDKKLSFLVDPTKVIGQGAEGNVYRVDSRRAMKIAKDGSTFDEDKLLALCTLGRKFKGIAFPTQPLYDESTGECVGYLMHFVEGSTLDDLLDQRATAALQLPTKIKLAKAIVAMVKRVHESKSPKVVLGDLLKAANLIINGDSATFVDAFSVTILNYRTKAGSLTDSISRLSTPGYTPPEVLENPAALPDHAGDRFALAVLLFQLFFGQLPSEPKPSPATVGLSPDDAVRQRLFLRYVESQEHEAATYDPIDVPTYIDDLFRAAFLSVGGRPTPQDWEKVLTRWQREIDVDRATRLKRIAVATKWILFAVLVVLKLIAVSAVVYSGILHSPEPTKPVEIPAPELPTPHLKDNLGSPLFKELFR